MYVVFCKIDHCIHIHWCIVMGLGHNDSWVESHMWPQQTWGQRSCRGQWPLVQVFGKKGQCIHILWCIFKSNITMIAKVCDRESRRDTWFENRLVWYEITYFVFHVILRISNRNSKLTNIKKIKSKTKQKQNKNKAKQSKAKQSKAKQKHAFQRFPEASFSF